MNGNKGLLDSNVIIDAAKDAISIQEIINKYDYLYTSLICYVETCGYPFADKEEQELIEAIVNSIEVVNPDKNIADIAINYRKQKKIKLPDALILATAKYLHADIITSNVADFQNIDTSVKIVMPDRKQPPVCF